MASEEQFRKMCEILGITEKTKTGERPDCTNCAVECEKERRSGWICGEYQDGSIDERQLEMKL